MARQREATVLFKPRATKTGIHEVISSAIKTESPRGGLTLRAGTVAVAHCRLQQLPEQTVVHVGTWYRNTVRYAARW